MKKISVIVPVYNVEDYLGKCLHSILNQTYANLEIILVNDGSTDSSGLLCDKYAKEDDRIKVVHKKNGGLSSARNAGLDNATGDYISFLDSDDTVASDFYESLIERSSSPFEVACSHIVRVDENGVVTPRNDKHLVGDSIDVKSFIRELLLHTGDVSVCSKLFHKDAIGNCRFDESRLNEDLLFMFDITERIERINFTGKVGYYYLCRGGSISSKYGKAIEDMVGNSIEVSEKAIKRHPSLGEEARRFALFQHMAFLLLVPADLRTNRNEKYKNALSYLRRNFLLYGLFNRYLTPKNKLIMIGQAVFPDFMSRKYQRTH